jgi:hypothetical protein
VLATSLAIPADLV